MKNNKLIHVAAGLLAASAVGAPAAETSGDAILNLLQKKGLLTEAEAAQVRAEQNKTAAAAPKTEVASWVNGIKLSGDFRGRFEGLYADSPAVPDRNRFRYRLRAGVIETMRDDFEVGFRLSSGEAATGTPGGNPLSGNATFQDNASRKLVFIDLAYGKWREVKNDTWNATLTLGKMENPFVLSDLIFDADLTPEGIAQQVSWKASDRHTVSFNMAGFVLDGLGYINHDAFLGGLQLRLDSKWSDHWQTSAGITGLAITGKDELVNGNVPNQNRGNSRPGANSFGPGALGADFNPIVADLSATYWFDSAPLYAGRFPVKLGGEYLENPATPTMNQAAFLSASFGKAAKKHQWEIVYRYKYLEGNSWYEELVDDDFGGVYLSAPDAGGAAGYVGGTNVRGHVVRAAYAVSDGVIVSANLFRTQLIRPSPAGSDSAFTRLQCDITWKF